MRQRSERPGTCQYAEKNARTARPHAQGFFSAEGAAAAAGAAVGGVAATST